MSGLSPFGSAEGADPRAAGLLLIPFPGRGYSPPAMLVAYYRVSTKRQERSGLGLDAQRAAVAEYVARSGRAVVAEYTEARSGRDRRRPELAAAVARAKVADATLIVAKLDRLARDVRLVLELVDCGARLLLLDFPDVDASTSMGRMLLVSLANVAEFEARRGAERTKEGLARRRARMLAGDAAVYRLRVLPLARRLLDEGLTLRAAAARLNERGVPTRKGRRWTLANLEAFVRGRNWTTGRPEDQPATESVPPAGSVLG